MTLRPRNDEQPPSDPVERHALDLLARRDHFSSDLRDRLLEAGFPADAVEKTIDSLRGRRLLDDDSLAAHKIARWRADGRSGAECRARLEAAGADDSSINAGLTATSGPLDADEDPERAAAILIIERARRGTTPVESTRLIGRLARRGFDADTIRAALRHCGLDDEPQPEDPSP